jgi:hypothetical protein
MDNIFQDKRRKKENEKHHPYDKKYITKTDPTYSSNKPSHVYSSPASLQKSLNKLFPGGGKKNA